MEKSKAIDLLDNLIGMIEDNQGNDYDTAFRMAIEALKAQLSQEGATSDLISRQQAIDAIENSSKPYVWQGAEIVRNLPPAQPEPHEGHWIKHKIRDQQFIQNGYELVRCSECGMETTANDLAGISLFGEEEPHYCPNCGAKMKGEPNEQHG